jgi:hypothetical protein
VPRIASPGNSLRKEKNHYQANDGPDFKHINNLSSIRVAWPVLTRGRICSLM